jgi:hypothetical protein
VIEIDAGGRVGGRHGGRERLLVRIGVSGHAPVIGKRPLDVNSQRLRFGTAPGRQPSRRVQFTVEIGSLGFLGGALVNSPG